MNPERRKKSKSGKFRVLGIIGAKKFENVSHIPKMASFMDW